VSETCFRAQHYQTMTYMFVSSWKSYCVLFSMYCQLIEWP
jgi:hypothetical protein